MGKKEQPIEILFARVKSEIITVMNNSGLPASMLDPLLCSVLVDVRSQENLELLNCIRKLQAQLEKEEGDE